MFLLVPSLLIPILAIVVLVRTRVPKLYGTVASKVNNETLLTYSPTNLEKLDIATMVIHLLLKYIPLYGCPRLHIRENSHQFYLDPIRLSGSLTVTEKDVAIFRRAFDNSSKNFNGSQVNPFLLIALTTPLVVLTLTHPESPIKPLGAVNTTNRFVFHDRRMCSSVADLLQASQKSELVFTAEMGGNNNPGRRKKRGVEIDVIIHVLHNTKPVLTQYLSFLQFARLPTLTSAPLDAARTPAPGTTKLESVGTSRQTKLSIPRNAPMRWAASTRDYNPIHISSIAAKLFGFKSAIAHGNHVAALLVQAGLSVANGNFAGGDSEKEAVSHADADPTMVLAKWLEFPVIAVDANEKKTTTNDESDVVMDVTFVKPVTPLPANSEVEWKDGLKEGGQRRIEFGLEVKGKWCVVGGFERS